MNLREAEELLAMSLCERAIHRLTRPKQPQPYISPEKGSLIVQAKAIVDAERARTAPGYVYLIKRRHLVKIGYSKNHDQRFRSLEMQCGEKIKILAVVPGTIEQERKLHRKFREYRQLGEWFECRGEMAAFARAPIKNMKAAMR